VHLCVIGACALPNFIKSLAEITAHKFFNGNPSIYGRGDLARDIDFKKVVMQQHLWVIDYGLSVCDFG
jgi:hypothetical protein